MTEIWLTYGLPASGKSRWAQRMLPAPGSNFVRVNMDDIRSMLGFGIGGSRPWSKELEEIALNTQDQAILSAVKADRDVIVDNTHIEEKMPKRIKRLFDGEITFHVKDFSYVSIDECVRRDQERADNNEPYVGKEVIQKMASRMKNAKWKLTEEYMNDVILSAPYVPKQGTPKAILVDIDGTVARHDHRSPYDYSQVLTDGVHTQVVNLIQYYADLDYKIIFKSGRPDINRVRRDTEDWLTENYIPFHALLMRPADMLGDNDADVKQFLFDKYVRYNYDVDFMLDDRNRVVRRMRKLDLKVLQVAEGNF